MNFPQIAPNIPSNAKNLNLPWTNCNRHTTRSRELDSERLSLYPNLDYKELYDTLYEFIPDLRIVNSSLYACGESFCFLSSQSGWKLQLTLGKSLLILLAALFPFMERNTIEDFPYNITELIDVLPISLCREVSKLTTENLTLTPKFTSDFWKLQKKTSTS